jgi:hypothetical protein
VIAYRSRLAFWSGGLAVSTGLAGTCARTGGLIGVGAVVLGVVPSSLTGASILGAVPTALAALAALHFGVETRRRRPADIAPT